MRITDRVHGLKISFDVTTPSGGKVPRSVYIYLIFGRRICLIDSGVAGSEKAVFDLIRTTGRSPAEISHLVLTHSHPDHIGAAQAIKMATGCIVCAHPAEKEWIEDTRLQSRERPVPGFAALVGGPVPVDCGLEQGSILEIDDDLLLEAFHTPGHSRGSISLRLPSEGALFTGDAIPVPGDIPIYEDVETLVRSIRFLMALEGTGFLLSSWDEPRQGEEIARTFRASIDFLRRVHESVVAAADPVSTPMEMCRRVLDRLGLPQAVANPLVTASFLSHLRVRDAPSLFR